MVSYKHLFKESLRHIPAHTHAAAHSHHLRPDVIRQAQIDAVEDSFRLADRKWDTVFGEIYPKAQTHIAKQLNTDQPENIVFAPNTHEFVLRLLSCLPHDRPPHILTTDCEFYSAARQFKRLEEDGLLKVTRIPTVPFDSCTDRMAAALETDTYDMAFISQVFFNSGFAVQDLPAIVSAVQSDEPLIVIDGYHGFMALPTNLSAIKDRVFYMAGGYKYAMNGEGSCFLHVPAGYGERPRNTGWFAGFASLGEETDGPVQYDAHAMRFAGSTFDPSGLYRLNAVMEMLAHEQITVKAIHAHVRALQTRFVKGMGALSLAEINTDTLLLSPERDPCGHFLTFETDKAGELCNTLKNNDILTDHRGSRLRFGFGLYHDAQDIDKMLDTLGKALK